MIKIFLIFLLIPSMGFSFNTGMKTIGGTMAFEKDLEDDETSFHINPYFGTFITDDILIEGGVAIYKYEYEDCDWNGYDVVCDKGTETESTFGIGAKLFVNSMYMELEYIPGIFTK